MIKTILLILFIVWAFITLLNTVFSAFMYFKVNNRLETKVPYLYKFYNNNPGYFKDSLANTIVQWIQLILYIACPIMHVFTFLVIVFGFKETCNEMYTNLVRDIIKVLREVEKKSSNT